MAGHIAVKHPFAAPLACAALAATLVACGGAGENANPATGTMAGTAAGGKPTIPLATHPDDPCGWIPASEVEAVAGKLAEPPRRDDGCLYTLVMPEAIAASRQEMLARQERLEQQLKARFKDYEPAQFHGSMANYQRDPRTFSVTLLVNVSGDMSGELGMTAAGKILQSWVPQAGSGSGDAPSESPSASIESAGWDSVSRVPYGFVGRVGHVTVTVQGRAPDVPAAMMQSLAARVRDRIPDRPFPAANSYQGPATDVAGKDPCGLLTRPEAEAVVGPLVVDPYRSSSDSPPLADSQGHSCAYFTAGHHVFALSPTWSDGEETFAIEKGVGGLIGQVLPQELTVIKGPWDKAQISSTTGKLLFLKGDRLLEVTYLTSSTDRKGAVRLAAAAMPRMTP
jgi:hypothetical protein